MRVVYSPLVILLSFGISNLGSYSAISACEQYRLGRIGTIRSRYIPEWAYLLTMAVCMGGVGIWCMHFVGMSAVKMSDDMGTVVEVRYHLGLTLLSLVLVILFSVIGFYISCHDVIFMKTKKEILEMYAEDVQKVSMQTVQHFGTKDLIPLILTKSTHRLLLGGTFTGSGVVIMHFVGIAAMKFPGRIVWSAGEVAASIIIAFVASTAAFWILFRLLSVYPNKENLRLSCSFIMSVAVCGMHYVGMFAATFHMDPTISVDIANTFSAHDAFYAGIVAAALTICAAAVLLLADLRYSVQRLSGELCKADALIKGLPSDPGSHIAVTVRKYIHQRRATRFSLGVLNETLQLEHVDDDAASVTSDHLSSSSSCYLPAWAHRLLVAHGWVSTDRRIHATYGRGGASAESSFSIMEQGGGGGEGVGAYMQVSVKPGQRLSKYAGKEKENDKENNVETSNRSVTVSITPTLFEKLPRASSPQSGLSCSDKTVTVTLSGDVATTTTAALHSVAEEGC